MFPIIPYNLNQTARSVSYSEVYTNTKLPKVTASCDIPRDTVSEPFGPKLIAGKVDNPNIQLDVEINDQKKLSLKSGNSFASKFHWIRAIRLADDCHGYNSRLCYQRSTNEHPNLFIQITRPIRTGHELLLWFSEDILAHLQMAFLTPANIQGQKKYVCHICSTTFEYPNPLKLHLTLDCDKQPISTIWDRLSNSMSTTNETKHAFGLELKSNESSKTFKKSYSVLNLSKSADSLKISTDNILSISSSKLTTLNNTVSNLPTTINLDSAAKSVNSGTDIQRTSSITGTLHSSAFKPYTTSRISRNNNSIDLSLSQSNSNFTNFLSNCQPQAVPTLATQNYSSIVDCTHAAQMETLVSNLGKSKQGHLCIYCGKCYSRKYGLKIHIRTHTGYKPLKCKYCLRPFGDPSNLNKHVRLHAEGDTPYKCELCGKVLVRRRDLERHLRSRHMSDMQLEEKNTDTVNSSSDHSDD